MSDDDSAFLLQAFAQCYDWGKLGKSSKVAQYAKVASPGFDLDENRPYAEVSGDPPIGYHKYRLMIRYDQLWMGTHPNLPSKLLDGTPLPTILKENPLLLGSIDHSDLPFLFKVIAIRKTLSIQSHPNKAQAEKLHAEHPHIYKGT